MKENADARKPGISETEWCDSVTNFSGPPLCSFLHDPNAFRKGNSSSGRSSKENRFPHAWSLTQLFILIFLVDAKINIENTAVFAIIHQTLNMLNDFTHVFI